MATTLKVTKGFEPVPAGNHAARFSKFIYLGTQHSQYGSKKQVLLEFELPLAKQSNGDPCRISAFYGWSLTPKSSLQAVAEGIAGEPLGLGDTVDIPGMLGGACMVQVKHKPKEDGNVRAVVDTVTSVPTGMEIPELSGAPLVYDFEQDGEAIPEQLPEWLHDIIKRAAEYGKTPESEVPGFDDDLPI